MSEMIAVNPEAFNPALVYVLIAYGYTNEPSQDFQISGVVLTKEAFEEIFLQILSHHPIPTDRASERAMHAHLVNVMSDLGQSLGLTWKDAMIEYRQPRTDALRPRLIAFRNGSLHGQVMATDPEPLDPALMAGALVRNERPLTMFQVSHVKPMKAPPVM